MNDTTTSKPTLPENEDGVDLEAAIDRIGLESGDEFRIGSHVYRYEDIYHGEIVLTRLNGRNTGERTREPISNLWTDWVNDNVEFGEWSYAFTPAQASSTSDPRNQSTADNAPSVEISRESAIIALTEIEHLIERTGGRESATKARSPLARVREEIETSPELNAEAREHVISVLQTVSENRNVELSDCDPLADNIFQAEHEFGAALEGSGGE